MGDSGHAEEVCLLLRDNTELLASVTSVCVLLTRAQKSWTCSLELGTELEKTQMLFVHLLFIWFSRQDLAIQISLT